MKKAGILLPLLAALPCLGVAQQPAATHKNPVEKPIIMREHADWSAPINGLQGRLLVRLEKLHPGLRYEVQLELRNASLSPLTFTNQPKLTTQLLDAGGMAVPQSHAPMSGPIPYPQMATLPRDAYIGFRVDMTTVGVPVKDSALLAVGGNCWNLKPGRYAFQARLISEQHRKPISAPSSRRASSLLPIQWTGEMELPQVTIVVTAADVNGE